METVGIWIQAFVTIALLSILFKENEIYDWVVHGYIGMFAGYQVCVQFFQFIRPSVQTRMIAEGKWFYIFPIIIGLLIYARYLKPVAWLARYNLAFLVGISSGYVLSTNFKALFIDQIRATMLPLWVPGKGFQTFSNWVMVVFVVCTLGYFVFSIKRSGFHGGVSRVGRIALMIGFGSAYGNAVMGRMSQFLGRIMFLLHDWLHLY
jgi:hypothetical protein